MKKISIIMLLLFVVICSSVFSANMLDNQNGVNKYNITNISYGKFSNVCIADVCKNTWESNGNPFNQSLNTTDSVRFNVVNATDMNLNGVGVCTGSNGRCSSALPTDATFVSLNVTGSMGLNVSQNVTAKFFIGDGSKLSGISASGGTSYNQSLNTTDTVSFSTVTSGIFYGNLAASYITSPPWLSSFSTATNDIDMLNYNIKNVHNITSGTFYGNVNASYIQNPMWINTSQEGNLNVNNSNYWDGLDTSNDITQMNVFSFNGETTSGYINFTYETSSQTPTGTLIDDFENGNLWTEDIRSSIKSYSGVYSGKTLSDIDNISYINIPEQLSGIKTYSFKTTMSGSEGMVEGQAAHTYINFLGSDEVTAYYLDFYYHTVSFSMHRDLDFDSGSFNLGTSWHTITLVLDSDNSNGTIYLDYANPYPITLSETNITNISISRENSMKSVFFDDFYYCDGFNLYCPYNLVNLTNTITPQLINFSNGDIQANTFYGDGSHLTGSGTSVNITGSKYLTNETGIYDVNETSLNATIDARATPGTTYIFNSPLYNTSNNVYINETLTNVNQSTWCSKITAPPAELDYANGYFMTFYNGSNSLGRISTYYMSVTAFNANLTVINNNLTAVWNNITKINTNITAVWENLTLYSTTSQDTISDSANMSLQRINGSNYNVSSMVATSLNVSGTTIITNSTGGNSTAQLKVGGFTICSNSTGQGRIGFMVTWSCS